MRILVLAVDHNAIFLEGLASLIREQPDMQLVGMANTARSAIAAYLQSRPDFTLVDLDLPLEGGTETIKCIREINPAAWLIGLAIYELCASAAAALAAGAISIVAKDQVAETLPGLIRSLFRR